MRPRTPLLAVLFASAALIACSEEDPSSAGGSSGAPADAPPSVPATPEPGTTPATPTTGYDVAYVQVGGGLAVGKSQFQLRLTNRADGTPGVGLADAVVIAPRMAMAQMSHGAPVPADAVKESGTPGLYDATLFPMASVDASGNAAGQWSLGVSVSGQPAVKLDVTVGMPMGKDTTHKSLSNAADTIGSMGMNTPRKYMLFRDTLAPEGGGHQLSLFAATIQEGMMVWPPLTPGLELKDAAGNVQLSIASVELSASTDAATWVPMTCDKNARCKATLSGLTTGVAGKAYVKMRINGQDYTTNGNAPDGQGDATKTNAFATFAVTP
jgi:hypothetical protein